MGCTVALLGVSSLCAADGPAPRDVVSPIARAQSGGDASEYWDLTIELQEGYRVMARFLITNQGPGKLSGIAVGHVISPNGRKTQFRNGRLQNGWKLSDDRRDLDIGKSHFDMKDDKFKLRINKPEARIKLSFAPNTLYRLPKKLTKQGYRIDLLALGAETWGSIQLEDMAEPLKVKGWATATHTIAERAETGVALRRFELVLQQNQISGENPLYIADFLTPTGKRSRWLAYLEQGCDPAWLPTQAPPQPQNAEPLVQKSATPADQPCLRKLSTQTEFDLKPTDAIQRPSNRRNKGSYWNPPAFDIKGATTNGRVRVEESFLEHEPLGDLPGPIRWLAGLSTKPKRVWSEALFEVTIRSSSDTKPIQFQGQGVATASYLNPVTRP